MSLSATSTASCGNSFSARRSRGWTPLEHNWGVSSHDDNTREQIDRFLTEYPYGYQDENGIDLSLILANLRMTPDERVRQAQKAAQQLTRMLDVRVP